MLLSLIIYKTFCWLLRILEGSRGTIKRLRIELEYKQEAYLFTELIYSTTSIDCIKSYFIMGEKLQRCQLLFVFLLLTTMVIHEPSTTYAINLPQLLSIDVSICIDVLSNLLTSIVCTSLEGTINPTSQCCLLLVRASACGTNGLLASIPPSSFTTAQLEILSQCGVESIPVPVASPALAPTPLPSPMAAPTIA